MTQQQLQEQIQQHQSWLDSTTTIQIQQDTTSHLVDGEISEVGRKAWTTASRVARQMSKESRIVNPNMEKCVPRFRMEEIQLGKLLGNGGFSKVCEVQAIHLMEENTGDYQQKVRSPLQKENRLHVANNVRRCEKEEQGEPRYACKFLSKDIMDNMNRFRTGAADLVVEAKFLASLSHPHIIKLRGMGAAGTSGFAFCQEMGYFIILDKLQGTLEDQIVDWKDIQLTNPLDKEEFLSDRLEVCMDVASALLYLHSKDIIFRDLKPDNVGFDLRGDVKLFDFGLAKELHPRKEVEQGQYSLSGNTGSRRYMSPEVALHQPYGKAVDVYGFGLLLWQSITLQVPYDGMGKHDHQDMVIEGDERPPISRYWSSPLKLLLRRSWEHHAEYRPSMESCYKTVKKEIISLRKGDTTGLDLLQRQSSFELVSKREDAKKSRKKRSSIQDTTTTAADTAALKKEDNKKGVELLEAVDDIERKTGGGALAA
mmetsp:Transcript_14075/g.19767  ORF Transcript_14075/g.19767 Transcript_14075/m.19767 type:complete len:482 (-) Transcript_14075:312-1757(-)